MENPLLKQSPLPYGAPQFDLIRNEHYLPAFVEGIKSGKAEIDAIVENQDAPTFENTVEAMENAGKMLGRVAGIFFNLNEAETNDEMESLAEQISPLMTEFSMYVSLNAKLFARVKAVWEQRDSLDLEPDQRTLLEDTYKSFVRNGANLSDEDKKLFAKYSEELSLLSLSFQKNVLLSSNSFVLSITDEEELDGLPDYLRVSAAETAKERGIEGWAFTLDAPSYGPFMRFSRRRDLRQKMYCAYGTRAIGGDADNVGTVSKIVELRLKVAKLLGYSTYADYVLEENMAKTSARVLSFLDELLVPSLPPAKEDVAKVFDYAKANGFEDSELKAWDFSFWAERYKESRYAVNEEELKPYFRLENCIDAVFWLANRLYGISFVQRDDLPVYHKDVKVYDVKDWDGSHLALFYADFFPRKGKRNGAWMTEFRGQSIIGGREERPFVSIVANFTKPTENTPSLITHDEFNTLLHEFGHALHGMLARGRYESISGTNVARDFVELPSQIMENWAFEPEYLDSFARDYRTGSTIPRELIDKLVASKNYLAGYYQVRQLRFGILDMAFHNLEEMTEENPLEFERKALEGTSVLPDVDGCAVAPSFGHIFSGGYAAGYYSYKWAEVLEADAFSLFKENGIFDGETADSFRRNILEKGGSEDAGVLYRRFRGHDPQPAALLAKLGLLPSSDSAKRADSEILDSKN